MDDLGRLLKEASQAMKGDPLGATAKLAAAFALAEKAGNDDDTAFVAEELARALGRRRVYAGALHYARVATKLAPEQRTGWVALAKTCELVGARTDATKKPRRARALYRAAAKAFAKGAALTKDPEDRRWLQELARDADAQSKG